MTRQTTEYSQNTWLARCRYGQCEDVKVRCPVCKHPGHVTTHVIPSNGKQYQVQISIQHSHFLENIDAGRNMFCDTEFIESVNPQTDIAISWRLNGIAKVHLIDYYARKLKQ